MGKKVFTDASVSINSIDLSSHFESATLTMTYDVMDATGFQPPGEAREYVVGLRDNRFSGMVFQDYASSASSTNPRAAVVANWTPVQGSVGEVSKFDVDWQIDGQVAKATS